MTDDKLRQEALAEVAREVACQKVGECFTQGTDVLLIARAVKAAKYSYLAAATAREKELASLKDVMIRMAQTSEAELATLRARVAELEATVATARVGECGQTNTDREPASEFGYVCTKLRGHSGEHLACAADGTILHHWLATVAK